MTARSLGLLYAFRSPLIVGATLLLAVCGNSHAGLTAAKRNADRTCKLGE